MPGEWEVGHAAAQGYIVGKELGTGKRTPVTGGRDLRTGVGPKDSCTAVAVLVFYPIM